MILGSIEPLSRKLPLQAFAKWREYVTCFAWKTAIFYNYGTYYDLREDIVENKYAGYYYHTPGEDEGGITIEYSNGNCTETGYHKVETGEDALESVLDR